MKRKAIVTGHKGFIGQNLLRELKSQGWDIVATSDRRDASFTGFPPHDFSGVDVVFHIGANSSTVDTDVNSVLNTNYTYTRDLVDMAAAHGTKVVFASSAAVYGLDHDSCGGPAPANLYAWSKLLCEDYGHARLESMVSLRYFNVYGPGEGHKKRMASMAWHAYWKKHHGTKISLFKDKPKRDFIYIKDVVSATIAAADVPGGVYEVGTGVAETFESLVEGMGASYDYMSDSALKPDAYQMYTKSFEDRWVPGWSPKHDLQTGTADYVNYLNYSGVKENG